MSFREFMSRIAGPSFVWRMAQGDRRSGSGTRASNAERALDDLVLERARTIQEERAAEE